jgi:hypothetical protein
MCASTSFANARSAAARLVRSFRSERYERSVAAEIESHLAFHAADRIRAGLSPADAQRDACVCLGGVVQTRERCLDAMTFRWIVRWLQR